MKSSFLCVIGIRLFCLAFAMDAKTEQMAQKDKSYLECTDLTGLSKDMILLVKRGEWPDDNDTLKEWVFCVLVKNNVMTEEGLLRLDVALKDLSKIEAEKKFEKIDKCLPTHTDNIPPEETSWHFAKCFQSEDPKNSLF